jgi:putative acetyltransferase
MINILRTTSENPDFKKLIQQLDRELWSRYDESQAQYDQHNKIEDNKNVVIVYIENEPVGCGCLKQFDDDTMELKRMFVHPSQRGKGIAYSILHELESWAKEHTYSRIILETGFKQPEAIELYKKARYKVIENYGPYVGMKESICMAKEIAK